MGAQKNYISEDRTRVTGLEGGENEKHSDGCSLGDQLEGDSTGFDHHLTAILCVILNSLLTFDKHHE